MQPASTFTIVYAARFNVSSPELDIHDLINLKRRKEDGNVVENICVVHPDFEDYVRTIDSNWYTSLADQSKEYFLAQAEKPALLPFAEIVNTIQFLEVAILEEEGHTRFEIRRVYDAQELLRYWIGRNTFTRPQDMQHIGLGQAIFDRVPASHNYFDMNWVCPACGDSGCYNYMAWYIRFQASYAVGFVVNHYSTLELNACHPTFQDEVYDEYLKERAEVLAHNKRVASIEEKLDKDMFYEMDEEEESIYWEGERRDCFPYLFELENFTLWQPLVNANKHFNCLKGIDD